MAWFVVDPRLVLGRFGCGGRSARLTLRFQLTDDLFNQFSSRLIRIGPFAGSVPNYLSVFGCGLLQRPSLAFPRRATVARDVVANLDELDQLLRPLFLNIEGGKNIFRPLRILRPQLVIPDQL